MALLPLLLAGCQDEPGQAARAWVDPSAPIASCPPWRDGLGSHGPICSKNLTCHYVTQGCCKHEFTADCTCTAGAKLACYGDGAAGFDMVCGSEPTMCSYGCGLGEFITAAGCANCSVILDGYSADLTSLLASHSTCASDGDCTQVALPGCVSPCTVAIRLGHEANLTSALPGLTEKWCPQPTGFEGPFANYCFYSLDCYPKPKTVCAKGVCTKQLP
ncbi:MAG: hypothetical protein HY902_14340 [Deltaproteobacteria bacterium]|nr:hypothetical protein [Deltaproteobacteria bacterium]